MTGPRVAKSKVDWESLGVQKYIRKPFLKNQAKTRMCGHIDRKGKQKNRQEFEASMGEK